MGQVVRWRPVGTAVGVGTNAFDVVPQHVSTARQSR